MEDFRVRSRVARRRWIVLLLAAFYTACGAWLMGNGGERVTVVSPDGTLRLEFHPPSRFWLLVHGEMRAPAYVQLHWNAAPLGKIAESAVVDLHRNHGISWGVGKGPPVEGTVQVGDIRVGSKVVFRDIMSGGAAGFTVPRTTFHLLDWIDRALRRGLPLVLLAGACFLALDLFLVGYTLATGRAWDRVGAAVQHSAWVFAGAAWVLAAVICMVWGLWEPFVAGMLLLGVGVIPATLFVMLPYVDRAVLLLIAAVVAAPAAWYVGRRLRGRAATLQGVPPASSSDVRRYPRMTLPAEGAE